MGRIHHIPKLPVIGIILTIITMIFLIDSLPIHGPTTGEPPHDKLEFANVRIGTLDLTVPPTKTPLVQRVTIQSDFSYPSQWCQWTFPEGSLCPHPISDGDQEPPQGAHDGSMGHALVVERISDDIATKRLFITRR